jgi:hypothetical protein
LDHVVVQVAGDSVAVGEHIELTLRPVLLARTVSRPFGRNAAVLAPPS